MESLPRALDNVLETLLCDHVVSSWKITAEGPNPTIVLRLRPTVPSRDNHNGYCAQPRTYRSKPPSQVERDRRRAAQFKQRRDPIFDKNIPIDLRENFTNKDSRESRSASVSNTNRDSVYMCNETVFTCSAIDPNLSREALRTGEAESTGGFDSLAIEGADGEQEMDQQSGESTECTGGMGAATDCDAELTVLHEAGSERDNDSVNLERERSVFESTPRTGDFSSQSIDVDSGGDSQLSQVEQTVGERPPRVARGRLSLKRRGRGQKERGGREGLDRNMTVKNTTCKPSSPTPSEACDTDRNCGPSSANTRAQENITKQALLAKLDEMIARSSSS